MKNLQKRVSEKKMRFNRLLIVLVLFLTMFFPEAFCVLPKYSPTAYVAPAGFKTKEVLNNNAAGKLEQLKQVLKANSGLAAPDKSAIKIGWDAVEEGFGLVGAGVAFSNDALGAAVLNNINTVIGELGIVFAAARLAVELNLDKPAPAVANFVKSATFYALGKFGFKALKISSIGIFVLDYSLNKFAAKAVEAKYQDWEKAYFNYYRKRRASPEFAEVAKRTAADWRKLLLEIIETSESPEQIQSRLEEEIDKHINAFWKDSDGMAFALGTLGKTAIHLDEKKYRPQINAYARKLLFETVLQPVFRGVAIQIQNEQNKVLSDKARSVSAMLNRMVTLVIKVVKPESKKVEYYPVKIVTQRYQKQWQGKTNAMGKYEHKISMLGLLCAEPTGEVILEGLGPDKSQTMSKRFVIEDPEQKKVEIVFNLEQEIELKLIKPEKFAYSFDPDKKTAEVEFAAQADPPGNYRFEWNLGEGTTFNKEVKNGQMSELKHLFKNLDKGRKLGCQVALFADNKEVASQKFVLSFEPEEKPAPDKPKEEPVANSEPAPKEKAAIDMSAAYSTHCRFFLDENGVITDSKNKLQWLICQKGLDWTSAKDWAENNGTDGGGWRLPSKKEAMTIQGAGRASLFPYGPLFTRDDGAYVLEFFWTSELVKHPQGLVAWMSQRGLEDRFTKHFGDHRFGVVAVRNCDQKGLKKIEEAKKTAGKLPKYEDRFSLDEEGVLTDNYTGLQWYSDRSMAKWVDAKEKIQSWKAGGGNWRMPSISEFRTLHSFHNPVFTNQQFFTGKAFFFANNMWSSDILHERPAYDKLKDAAAWYIDIQDGYEKYSSLNHPFSFNNFVGVRNKK